MNKQRCTVEDRLNNSAKKTLQGHQTKKELNKFTKSLTFLNVEKKSNVKNLWTWSLKIKVFTSMTLPSW